MRNRVALRLNRGRWSSEHWSRLIALVDLMTAVAAFYSRNETFKAMDNRVYHDNEACPIGRDIPANERQQGMGNYRLCDVCNRLNDLGR
jgi:hypothetical protein